MIVIVILAFIFVAVMSSLITRAYLTTSQVGNLVIKESDEEDKPYIFLEVFQSRMDDIKPGHLVKLMVTRE